MKKLTQMNLDVLSELLPVLDEEDQRGVLGGTNEITGCIMDSGAYTWEEMDALVSAGNWGGGYVAGMGYVGEVSTVTGFYKDGGEASWFEDVWDSIVDETEADIDKFAHSASGFCASVAEGFAYAYLDFKYNGLDAGYGKGKIPLEAYLGVKDEFHAYHFSWDNLFYREGDSLADNLSYKDFQEIVDVISKGICVNVSLGGSKIIDYALTYGVNQGIKTAINKLVELGIE